MTLLNAPEFNERSEKRKTGLLVGSGAVALLVIVIGLGGYIMGHGWFFSLLPVEHHINVFLNTLEAKDYNKAYGIWMNDPNWQQHPQKYDYTIQRFTEDWTTASDWGPITSHHVEISKRTGSGVIIAVKVNHSPKELFLWYEKSNGTMTYSPYELGH